MDETWNNYPPAAGHRQSQGSAGNPPQQREARNGSSHRPQASSGLAYEAYHAPTSTSHSQDSSMSTTRSRAFSVDQDVTMEDADPYNRTKYPSRTSHQRKPSGHYLANEDSSAARRYSPMKALSPGGPYSNPQTPNQGIYNSYNSPDVSARQSPTRANYFSTPSQTYPTGSQGPLGSSGKWAGLGASRTAH